MRRPTHLRTLPALPIAAVCALAVAACGSSSTTTTRNHRASAITAPPAGITDAISFFPSAAPVVGVLDTDPSSAGVKALKARQDPTSTAGKAALFQELAGLGIDYNRDVKPLFGKPIAVGLAGVPHDGSVPFELAWQTADADALKRLVTQDLHATAAGSHAGASLYSTHGVAIALKGPLVIAGDSAATVDAALDRHDAGSGMTADTYARDLGDQLPDAALTVVGDPRPLIKTDPDGARALRVPWLAALTGYGVSLSGDEHSVKMRLHARTDGRSLTAAQLPIATGSAAPGVAGTLPIDLGVRNPSQLWTFGTSAVKVADPSSYSELLRTEARARRDGIDLDKLAAQFSGDMALTSDGHATIARAALADPSYVTQAIQRLAAHPIAPADGGRPDRFTSLGDGLYRVAEHGSPSDTEIVGVVDKTFVFGDNATAQRVRAYASEAATPVAGAVGSVAFRFALAPLIAMSHGAGSDNPAIQKLLAQLGDLTGSVRADPSGLTADASLALK